MLPELPIHSVIPELLDALSESQHVILQAPPGAGKTTAVPLALLEEPWLDGRKIVLLEPRRLAARHAAMRMAQLLGEKIGQRVGYRIRMEKKISSQTRIEVVTEGVLTRMLQRDPALETIGAVLFDEFHERSLHADLALALTLQSCALLRDDLKLLVMSATLNTEALSHILQDAPVIRSKGRTFPVEHRYLDIKRALPDPKNLPSFVASIVLDVLRDQSGSVLVFLPGAREIRSVESLLNAKIRDANVMIAPLYGDMNKTGQQQAIDPVPQGRRKVVLATNIAETSLTIEGVRVVIDSGLERTVKFDPASGMNKMTTVTISRDSAIQRCGRAGRTAPGVCYRLWHENRALSPHALPEILHSDLAPMMLELAKWGVSEPKELTWLDPPPEHGVQEARRLLRQLGMVDASERITAHGEAALKLGAHPRLAHMLLKARKMACIYEASLVAALLEERDFIQETVDMQTRLEAVQGAQRGDPKFARILELSRRYREDAAAGVPKPQMIPVLIAMAYPERIARRREGTGGRYLLANGKGARLLEDAVVRDDAFLAVADVGGGSEGVIFRAAPISPEALETYLSDQIATRTQTVWNGREGRVETRKTTHLGAIVLSSQTTQPESDEAVSLALIEGIRQRGPDALPWDKGSRSLRARVNFIAAHAALISNEDAFVTWSDEALLLTLEQWLMPFLEGFRDLKSLQKLPLETILLSRLSYDQQQRLDRLAPVTVTVPSGSRIRIDYSDPEQPVLAVRLQELFGLQDTPKVLGGKMPLLLHLLSPAHRPMQVTKDLASFWKEGYAEVRKELRGKYKKHYWPENPYEAVATSKTKKKM